MNMEKWELEELLDGYAENLFKLMNKIIDRLDDLQETLNEVKEQP